MTAFQAAHSIGSSVLLPYPTVKRYFQRFCFSVLVLFCVPTNAQTLDSSQLPAGWLRADAGWVSPQLWNDCSGNRRVATAIASEAPRKNALFNYNAALACDGVN